VKILQYISQSRIYYALLMAMAVSLPLSKAFMSIFTGCLMLNWLVEGDFQVKLQRLKERKSVLLFISIFFAYLVGLLWTNNMQWGMHDVKIQLPLLILPLVIGTSEALNQVQVKRIVYAFSLAVIIASLCSIFVLFGFSGKSIQNPREMSLFISHIHQHLFVILVCPES
jgi:O-antigen ligase